MGIFSAISKLFSGQGKTAARPTPPAIPPVPKSAIEEVRKLVLPLEGHDLDPQQLECIAADDRSHLVLAGAGTGKTTTVVGLVKFLLASGKYQPNEILALSFTRASAEELCARIKAETGHDLDAMTFHKLGLDIIAAADGRKPSVSSVAPRDFARHELDSLMQDSAYARRLGAYLHNRRNPRHASQFDFADEAGYAAFLEENPPITMKGERVKSLGEVTIANFLFYNSIDYEYECAYERDTADEGHAQYHPDFYLPATGTYIEFYAVGKDGQAPSWFKGRDGKSGSQAYLDGIAWKRKLHRDEGTDCIELFVHQEFEGSLQGTLKAALEERGIPLVPIDPEALWSTLSIGKDKGLASVAGLFGTLISLLKSKGITVDQAKAMTTDRRERFTLSLLEPVYSAYQRMLAVNSEIDFDDMVNTARDRVREGRYHHPYKFVIIDEYQDISASRQGLVQSMRDDSDFRLFCVGDDWQSIYRFSGSDVGYILNFQAHWGQSRVSRIETTRRSPQSLIDVSGAFVMANPKQARKSLRSSSPADSFAVEEIVGYTDKWAMEFAVRRMEELPKGSSVLLLGRYTFDLELVRGNSKCSVAFDRRREVQAVKLAKRPDLDVVFRTVHGSKGLEADYVFVLNNRKDGMGFPSKIEDDPVVAMLQQSSDVFPNAEERRLFYVALTRARKKVFLLTVKGRESCFVIELREAWGEQMQQAQLECPWCGGKLHVCEGPYGRFWGCSNYRSMGCKFKRKIAAKTGA